MRARLHALLLLAWPVVLARSSQAVIGFSDALMTASLGEEALAAVTTGAMNFFALVILPMGIAVIVQSFAAQLKGRGDLVAARRYAWYGIFIALAAEAAGLAALPFLDVALGWLDYEPLVRIHMTDYLRIRLLGVGVVVAIEVFGNWYGGLGNTHLHMVAGVVAMIVNVFLNWVLIFGHLGAPALGVEGAALASVLASAVGLAILVLVFNRRWFLGGASASERATIARGPLGLRKSEMWRVLRFGLPNGINWFFEFAAIALFLNVVVAHLGTTVLAAMMVVFNINSVSFMPAFGMASSGAILVGQAIGAGRRDEVPGLVRLTAAVTALWQGSVGLVYVAIPTVLMSAFAEGPEDRVALLAVGASMLAISAAWQLFDALSMTVSEALRAAGDTTWPLVARLAIAWLVFVPSSFLTVFVYDGGYVGAMLCLIGYFAVLAAAMVYRLRSGAWRRIELVSSSADPVV